METLLFTVLALLSVQQLVQGSFFGRDEGSDSEAKLSEFIANKLKAQGRIARPVLQANEIVTVTVGLSLLRLRKPQGNSVEVDAYLRMYWKDPRLTWDRTQRKYGDAQHIAVPADSIWLPDIRSYSVFGMKPDSEGPIRVRINNTGGVFYVQPCRIQFDCAEPFGSIYNCQTKFGSWVHNAKQLDIKMRDDNVDLTKLQASDWMVSDSAALRQVAVYPCCAEEQYVVAAFNITVKPKTN